MTYTLQGPFTDGGTCDAANLTAMDAGIGANDTAISGSQTPSESATPAASGSVATLLGFIASQIKLITGGAHWYSAPAATLASLLTAVNSKVSTSGDTMTGTLTVPTIAGAVSVDVEGGQTVFRVGTGASSIVIQVNGHNWTFRSDGTLLTPTGAVIH